MYEYLAVAVSFIGFFAGMIVAYFSKEELDKGKRYILLFRKYMAVIIGVAIAYYAWGSPIYFVLGLVAGYYLRYYYFYLGLMMALVFGQEPFLLLSSLMFLFGIPHGTVVFKGKELVKIVLLNIILFFVPFFVFLKFSYSPLLLLSSGALVVQYFVKEKGF